ncbi:MAG TPA: hypothetical protein VMT45_16235 [Thermoanaerobaculaceae bacterium]|nr:hypothetical protein [Thermoanaerobaculaceae bacterium]
MAERPTKGSVPLREAHRAAAEVAREIALAPTQGMLLRDLKPGNVFLCRDEQVRALGLGMVTTEDGAGGFASSGVWVRVGSRPPSW